MEINKVYQEPCLETLKKMPNDFLDCVITSPPYWQLRDYGYEGQWGLEPTYQGYLEHLWEMMDEIYRVLKPTGTCWINLGDTYGGGNSGKGGDTGKHKNENPNIQGTKFENGVKKPLNKCLLLIPHRFAIGCIERGWIVRNDIIWAKRNGMPESITDRFSKKHEYIFFMTKNEKYYFDLDSVRDKVKASSLERYKYGFSGNKNEADRTLIGYTEGDKTHLIPTERKTQYSIIEEQYRNPIVEYRDLPNQDELRNYLSEARKQVGITIQEIENIFNTQAPHHWFEKNGSYPSAEDWLKLKDILKFDDKYDFQMTEIYEKSGLKQNHPLGKNCGDVADFWDTYPNSNSKYSSQEVEAEHRQGMHKNRGQNLIEKRPNLPTQSEFVEFIRRRIKMSVLSESMDIPKTTIEHWFRNDEKGFSFPSVSDWNEIKQFLDNWDEEFYNMDMKMTYVEYETDDINKNNEKGKNCGDVADFWDITTKPNKSSHYATYNDELLRKPILAGCPEGGLIYDPFMGSGTTAEGAIRAKRNFIGSEMSSEYMAICNKRIQTLLSQPTLF